MKDFLNINDARQAFGEDRDVLAAYGVILEGAQSYLPAPFKRNAQMAMDSAYQASLITDPNSSIPSMLTTFVDPNVIDIYFSPNKIAAAVGEEKKGDWTTDTAMFPVVEQTGEVSSYGDRNNNGRAGINMNWPQFQQYRYQTIIEYGDLEMSRAGLAKINYASQLQASAASIMGKFENTVYAFGVQGLYNYGLINNPYLSAALTPATKVAGGTTWDNATANEIFDDIKTLVVQLVSQLGGLIDTQAKMTLILGQSREALFSATNSFNVNVHKLIKDNYPNLKVVSATQYDALSASNQQGNAAGNLMQLIADEVEGEKTVYTAFSEKLRAHPIIVRLSSWAQKRSGGAWGTILRIPVAVAQMVGI